MTYFLHFPGMLDPEHTGTSGRIPLVVSVSGTAPLGQYPGDGDLVPDPDPTDLPDWTPPVSADPDWPGMCSDQGGHSWKV